MQKPRILCVDDNIRDLKLLEAILSPVGYEITMAVSGEEAMVRLTQQRTDLVLMDVMMPDMNGIELCRIIKNDEFARHIPVVLITSLSSTGDRVQGIQAGAEDFISKPFHREEVLARIEMLLKMKTLNDRIRATYEQISVFTSLGEKTLMQYNPTYFRFDDEIEHYVIEMLCKNEYEAHKPRTILLGKALLPDNWEWELFGYDKGLSRQPVASQLQRYFEPLVREKMIWSVNPDELDLPGNMPLAALFNELGIAIVNGTVFMSKKLCILCVNYDGGISNYESSLFHTFIAQTLFLQSISERINEVEDGFKYMIRSLAKTCEQRDDADGPHVYRVGEYAYLMATALGESQDFCNGIRLQSILHDVGKVHISENILNKPGPLSSDEFDAVKKHAQFGVQIIGSHPGLRMAAAIAVSHHENWDGSGYPKGLAGDAIPLEGRIVKLADQYDVLRTPRSYKASFSHEEAVNILLNGDGRTKPEHFDPRVLACFRELAAQFDEIYQAIR